MLTIAPCQGFSAQSLHVLPMSVWVLCGNFSFLPQSKDMHQVRITGDSELPIHVNVSVYPSSHLMVAAGPIPIATLQ